MTWLTRLGLEKPSLTVFVMLAMVVMGSLLFVGFPKSEEPEITIRTAVVSASFPGMPPARLEQLIAEPIERKIRQLAEVKTIETLLVTGDVTIHVTVHDRFADLAPIWQELRDKMEEVVRELPPETFGPYVNTDFGDVTIASIAMTAEGFSYREMETTAKELQRRLYTIEGIGKVALHGVQRERIWLEFDAERLAAVGVQLEPLIQDLRAQNVILPAGQLNADGSAFLLEASGDLKSVDQIEALLTKSDELNNFVRVADLVSVRRGYVDPPETRVFFDGRPAVVIGVVMQTGSDILAVGHEVTRLVREFEAEQPIGFSFDFATFQPTSVASSVNNALANVAETFVVVLVVVMVFLGIRTGMIIATIVPFALLAALIGMTAFDIVLEQVSIAAVIISLGLLVDNGVVIVEDVLRRLEAGSSPSQSAFEAGKQFAMPLAVASATTIFAFLPFFLMEGAEGEYSFSLGAVLALSLVGSWFCAMYILPLIASKTLKVTPTAGDGSAVWTARYHTLLEHALPRSKWIVGLAYLAVLGGVGLFALLPAQLFPDSERSEVLIYVDLPKGAHISETERISRKVGRWIADKDANPEVVNQLLYVGDGGPRFYLALDPADRSPSSAFILVNTEDREGSLAFLERARSHLYTYFPEARFRVKRLTMGSDESGIVEVEISGPELDRLMELADSVEDAFHEAPLLVENQNDWGAKVIKVVVDLDQDNARRLGISSDSLSRVLGAYFDGYSISDYREDDQSVPIVLRAMHKDRDTIEDIANISVLGRDGVVVPLDQVAVTRGALEYSQIRRKNQQRMITVTAKSDALTAQALLASIEDELAALDLSGGYRITFGGEIEDSEEIYGELGAGLPAAVLLMLLVIVYQFDSLKRAIIVFMTVPLVLVGAPFGLLLSGQPVSFMGTLGLISLAGIIINNGIVLIDQIDIERRSAELGPAIVEAATKRIRPILLTSVTTVLGLLPLFLFGGPLWEPLAAVIIGGLSIASGLTLLFVPAAYHLLQPANQSQPLAVPDGTAKKTQSAI